jgi:hypothetical protein
MTAVTGFPNTFQSQYARMPKAGLPGMYWEGDLHNQTPASGLIARVTEVAYAATVTIAAFNSGDEVGVTINGGTIAVTAVTDADATAALLNTAINAAGFLSGVLTSTVTGAALTLTGALGVSITASEYSPDATTAAFTGVTASVVQQQLLFGMAVVKDVPSTGTNFNKIRKATSASDIFAGVLAYSPGSDIPPDQILAAGENPNYLMPGQTYCVERANCGLYVEYIGTAPTETDPVYRIYSGTNSGLWRINSGQVSQVTQGDVVSNYVAGTAQVTRGDVQFSTTDDVGVNVDGMAPLFVPSDTSDDITVAALVVAWNANPAYFALATATADTSGAESWFILTFNDTLVHTVTAYSPATATVATITNTTAAVAAVADLVGVTVDSLPTISVASITDDDTTATALAAAWNGSASHAAVATATADLAGATSLLVLTFLDGTTHTVTAYSPATADVTSITNTTAAVAATAALVPGYSWGSPSITTDVPARARLRLSNP